MIDIFLNNLNMIYDFFKENIIFIIILVPIAMAIVVLVFYIEIKEAKIKEAFKNNEPIYFNKKNEIIILSKSNGWILEDNYFKKNDKLIKIENNSDNLSLNIQ